MDYIYSKLDAHLVDINQIEYITLKVCSLNGEPLETLKAGDYYLETKIVDSDKLIYTNLAPINRNNTSVLTKLEQEIKDRINQGNALQTNIDNEAKRTDNMINQLNENVHSQLTQLNKILVDSINTINGGIEEERKIREEADNTLQSNLDKESKRVDSMINQVNANIKVIVDQLNQNIASIVETINTNLDNESKERLKQDTILDNRITEEVKKINDSATSDKDEINKRIDEEVATLNSTISSTKQELQANIDAVDQDLQDKYEHAMDSVSASFDEVRLSILEEATRAQAAEKQISDNLAQEIQDRKDAITTLSHALDSEVSRATAKEELLETSINNEKDRATQAENTLTEKINAEVTRATGVESTLSAKLDKEIQDRTNDINTLSTALNAEIQRATNKDTEHDTKIAQEIERATTAETTLSTALTKEIADREKDVQTLTTNLNAEIKRSTDVDTQHSADLSTLSNNLQVETNRASQAEENLHTEFIEGISQERQERISADDALSTRLDNLEGKTTRLYYGEGTLSSPTATEIQSFVTNLEVDPPYTPPYSGIAVVVKLTDENTYHIWHYYSNLASWKDDGVDLVNTFTNATAGIITGTISVGYISAVDGFGKVNGWEDLNSTVSNNYETLNDKIEAETTRATEAETSISSTLSSHTSNFSNPHKVTKDQVGLGNVDNTSDLNKPISTATQEALDNITDTLGGINTSSNSLATLSYEIIREL